MAGDVKPKAIPKTIVEMLAIITETMAPEIMVPTGFFLTLQPIPWVTTNPLGNNQSLG